MHTKRLNRRLCFWNFASLLQSWHNRPGRHHRALQTTGCLYRLSRLAPNFPYRRGLLALSLVLPATALAGPAGEQVTNGIATVTRPNAVTTLITQQTPKAIIDWQNFSIGQQEMVRFQQPGTDSIALNRVLGHDPSRIYGSLTANGQIFLVNPSGVLFAPGSQVSVHGLLATTHNLNNDDFLTGRYTFAPQGTPYSVAEVANQGSLVAGENGYIVLAGDYTANTGVISARLGQVALASGNRFTIDLDGDRLIGLAVDEASLAQRAGVANFGTLAADGGRVVMTAKVAGELAGTVVNNAGLVQAQSIGEQNGEIILYGGTYGIVANSGTLDASGKGAGETGGNVRMLGEKVGLLDKGVVDVSGANGGGTALIGGDYQGRPMQLPLPFTGTADPLPTAAATYLGRDTVIRADATENGDGGRVIVWADDVTRAYGSISARGGATGGDGGFVEVSGRGHLDFQGMVSTLAPLGRTGTLLLDPTNIYIAVDQPAATSAGMSGTDTSADTSGAPDFNATTAVTDSLLLASTLQTALSGGSVTVSTVNASGTATGAGDINVVSPLAWAGAGGLTLTAERHINILNGATITPTGTGTITMNATGDIFAAATAALDTAGGAISLNSTGGTITLNNTINTSPATDAAGGNISINASGNITSTAAITAAAANSTAPSTMYSGGTIQITSSGGGISLTNVAATGSNSFNSAGDYDGGNGGNITLSATTGTVNFISVSTQGGQGFDIGTGGTGGLVNISGLGMTLGGINTGGGPGADAAHGGVGGNITITDSDALMANNNITAMGAGNGNGGNISITGDSLSLPNATSDVFTNNLGLITLEATAGNILQGGSATGAIVQGPKVILKAITGITGNCSGSPCASMVVVTPELDITNSTSGEVSLAASAAVATVIKDLDSNSNSLVSAGDATISGNTNGYTLQDTVNVASLYLDTSGPLIVDTPLTIPSGKYLHLGGDSMTINQNVSAPGVELKANSINVTATKSVTATGPGTGVNDGMRFTPYTGGAAITLIDSAGAGLVIDPADLATTGNTFNANGFEFDASSTGTVTIAMTVNVTGANLAFEGGTVDVNASVTGKNISFMANNLDLATGTPVITATDIGINTTPYTVSRSIVVAATDPGSVLWIDSDVLNNIATPQFVADYLNVGDDAMTGNISIVNALSGDTSTFTNLGLVTSGAGTITQSAAISLPTGTNQGSLKISGGSGAVTLENALNSVDFFTATTTSGDLSFTNSKSFAVVGDGIKTVSSDILLAALNGGDIAVQTPGINGCYGITVDCTSTVTLSAAGSIQTPLIRATTVSLYAGASVVDTDGGLNNIVSGNDGLSVTLNYDVVGTIDLDAWGATPGGTTLAGTDSVRWSQPAVVEPPPPPPALPTIDECAADPTLTGCTTVLPTLDACTTDPTLPGCTVVLPTLDACILDPAAPGCSAVLPTIDACITDPTAAGCTTVLPTLDTCILNPAAPGCSAVLPTIDACITDPTAAGCTTVLPTLDTCILNPAAPGCSAVLPLLTDCTTNPTLAGCSAVLPALATCIATPTAPGCTAVLPPLTDCTTNPALPGCTAVLPALETCATTPTAPGCSAVLPTFDTCVTDPTLPGCTAVLPPALIETPPTEVTATILAVVTLEPVTPMQPTVTPTRPAAAPSDQQGDSGNNEENKERSPEGVPLTTASQELPLAKQPIFDLSGGGIAGQNMVCR